MTKKERRIRLMELLSEIQGHIGELAAMTTEHNHEPRHCRMCSFGSKASDFNEQLDSHIAEIDWLL